VTIYKEVTPENPLVFVQKNGKLHVVLVHVSLVAKSVHDGGINGIKGTTAAHDVVRVLPGGTTIKQWQEWAKKVKAAPWGDKKQETTFRVIIPRI